MLPDIDSLALFVQAAEQRSLTKAAEASHIGPAAASRRIALLEDRFKATLFERSSRGVELTAAGVSLLAHAKPMLVLMNQMQSEMKDHAAGRKGALRLLANTSAMTQFLPDDLASFNRACPDIRLVIEERWSPEIVRAVLAAEADLGIVVEGVGGLGLELLDYRSDRLAAVVPEAHPLARASDLRFVDVLDHDIIALESGSSMMRLLAEQAVVLEKNAAAARAGAELRSGLPDGAMRPRRRLAAISRRTLARHGTRPRRAAAARGVGSAADADLRQAGSTGQCVAGSSAEPPGGAADDIADLRAAGGRPGRRFAPWAGRSPTLEFTQHRLAESAMDSGPAVSKNPGSAAVQRLKARS